ECAFELRVFIEMELLPLRFRLLPRVGQFSSVAIGSLGAPLGEAFLATACVSFGESDRDVLGLDLLHGRRRLPRHQLDWLWRPGRAAGSVLLLHFASRARLAIE